MPGALCSFGATLAAVWAVLCIAGYYYAQQLSIPAALAVPSIAAFLVETCFYLLPGFERLRAELRQRLSPRCLAAFLALSAVVPYCVYSVPSGLFRWSALAALALLAALVSFWYAIFPVKPAFDLAFLALMAVAVIAKLFAPIYGMPAPRVRMEILGQLMWIRTGVMAVLLLRGAEGVGFGFLPRRREWLAGLRNYLWFAPLGLPIAVITGFAHFQPPAADWRKTLLVAVATFLGMLWVVALSEEFFFRGLLQQWLSNWMGSNVAGLVGASILFGLVHLPFRSFPNWRFALVAAIAGWFYGRAFLQTGSIRAAMVTHALVITTWRMLFA